MSNRGRMRLRPVRRLAIQALVRRRLPLLVRPDAGAEDPALSAPWVGARTPLPGAIGVADTGDGEEALGFARDLAAALGALGAAPHLALTALGRPPALSSFWRAALARVTAGVSLHAITPETAAVLPSDRWLLVVGVPALAAFAPGLAVLLGGQRPPSRWPAALRSVRDQVDLALSAPRPRLAAVLAATLAADGFLLPRGDGVR